MILKAYIQIQNLKLLTGNGNGAAFQLSSVMKNIKIPKCYFLFLLSFGNFNIVGMLNYILIG